jgi:hypothetical protein
MSTFSELSRTEKRDVIRGEPFDGVQVTMAPKSVRDLLDTLDSIPNNKLATTHPAAGSLALIDDNWGVDMASFPPPPPMYGDDRTFRPAGDAATWDLRLLATLAVLSEFTQGQGDYIGGLVNSAVELRNTNKRFKKNLGLVTVVDVVRVIRDLLHPLNEDVSFVWRHFSSKGNVLIKSRSTRTRPSRQGSARPSSTTAASRSGRARRPPSRP